MKILARTEFGNPILRRPARNLPLGLLKTARFKKLVQEMIYTMRRVGGVGLAAPQIGESLNMAVMEMRPTATRPHVKKKRPIVIVNPKILRYSESRQKDWEGCLSFSGVRGSVPRSKEILVEYTDELGKKVQERASGLWARIFQHEIDHLRGKVYIDRMEDMKTLMTISEFKKTILKRK